MISRTFLGFVTLRTLMAIFSQSWHVPDETWQSVEIAHKLVFGFGVETWEWKYQIRSYLQPLIFASGMEFLKIFGIDSTYAVVIIPRLIQGLISAIGDICMVKFCAINFGVRAKSWFYLLYVTNIFINYCSSRPLINTLEMALTSIALYLYPNISDAGLSGHNFAYIPVITISFFIRSTTAIFWLPLVLYHVWTLMKLSHWRPFFVDMIPIALCTIAIATAVDSIVYGQLVCVPWNFFKINLVNDVSSLYGVNPWHWYLTSGLPALFGPLALIPFLLGCFRSLFKTRKAFVFAASCWWTILVFSIIAHKEMRFLLPIVPLGTCFAADWMARQDGTLGSRWAKKAFCALAILVNIPAVIYLSMIHQIGTTNVLAHLSEVTNQDSSIFFLMPCHSTPLYSHLHRNISIRFLSCEPNLEDLTKDLDEDDQFFENPTLWLSSRRHWFRNVTHVVLYDNLVDTIKEFLIDQNMRQCADFFHANFIDGRIGHRVKVFCRQPEERYSSMDNTIS